MTDDVKDGQSQTRAFVTLVAVSTITFFQMGSMKAFGVFIPEFTEHLSMTVWSVGVVGGLSIGLRALLGPLWSVLARLLSCRALTISGGVLFCLGMMCSGLSENAIHLYISVSVMSIGVGFPTVAKVMELRKTFSESNFGMANGVTFASGGLGMIVFAPLMEILIQTYGWRGALFLYGAMNLNICAVGLFFKPGLTPPATEPTYTLLESNGTQGQSHNEKCTPLRTIYTQLGFHIVREKPVTVVLLAAITLHEISLSGWLLFLVSYIISIGQSSQNGSYLSAIGGVGVLFGRLLLTPLIDRKLISGQGMFCILTAGSAITLASYPFTEVYWQLAIISFASGLFLGAATPVFIVVLHELFPDNSDAFSSAVGLQYLTRGIGRIIGGSVTGQLYDNTSSFYASLLMLAGTDVVATFMTAASLIYSLSSS